MIKISISKQYNDISISNDIAEVTSGLRTSENEWRWWLDGPNFQKIIDENQMRQVFRNWIPATRALRPRPLTHSHAWDQEDPDDEREHLKGSAVQRQGRPGKHLVPIPLNARRTRSTRLATHRCCWVHYFLTARSRPARTSASPAIRTIGTSRCALPANQRTLSWGEEITSSQVQYKFLVHLTLITSTLTILPCYHVSLIIGTWT